MRMLPSSARRRRCREAIRTPAPVGVSSRHSRLTRRNRPLLPESHTAYRGCAELADRSLRNELRRGTRGGCWFDVFHADVAVRKRVQSDTYNSTRRRYRYEHTLDGGAGPP